MGEKVRRGQLAYWVSFKDAGEAGDPRLHRNSSALESLPYFCTTANLQSAVVYLSQELQGMGLGCPLIETEGQRINLVALVNALWEVTQLYRSSVRDTSVLQDQRRRDTVDMNHFQNSIKDLRGEVDEKERLVCEAQEKERQATTNSKTLTSKLKAEKEEVRRLTSIMQQREAHHQHELKKKEMENVRLQDRLHRLVSGARSADSRQPTLSLSSTLSRVNRSRAKWKTEASSVRHEEELYKRVLTHYEAWIGQVNDENAQLKSSLLRISSHMSKAVEKYSKQVDVQELPDGDMNSSMTSSTFSTDSLDDLAVNMEFPAYRDRLQNTFDDNMRTMVLMLEEAAGARKAESTNTEKEKELKEELEDLRRELKATKEELASHTYAVEKYDPEKAMEKEASFVVEGRHVEEEAWLEKERQRLVRERELLEEERRSFAEATIRLNRERAAFEAEKGELLKEQFLQDLPATLETDLTLVGQDSCGSLSSGSIGEIFDSPQRIVAFPSITSPTGNITYVPGSSLVLGPTRLSKQQQQQDTVYGSPGSRSAFRFRSAPASRASSIPRQYEEKEHTPQRGPTSGSNSSIRPPHSRPRTLERLRRKSYSSSASPVKSRSHSQENLIRDNSRSRPTRPQGELEDVSAHPLDPHNFKANLQQHKDFLDCVRRDRLYSDPPSYSSDALPYTKRHSGSLKASHGVRLDAYSQDNLLKGTSRSDTVSQEDLYSSPQSYSRDGSPYARRHSGSQKGVKPDTHTQENLSEPTSGSYQRDTYSQENICHPLSYIRDESTYTKRHSGSHKASHGARSNTHTQDNLHEPPSYQDELYSLTSGSYTGDESSYSKRQADSHKTSQGARSDASSQHNLFEPPSLSHTADNSTVEALEADLAELMEHIVGQQKVKEKPTAKSALTAAPPPPRPASASIYRDPMTQTSKVTQQIGRHKEKSPANSALSVYPSDSVMPDSKVTQQLVDQQNEKRVPLPSPPLSQPPPSYPTDLTETTEISKYTKPPPPPLLTQSSPLQPPPPPPYPSDPMTHTAEVTQAKKGKPRMLSFLRSAPGNLFSSRRGSEDLSASEHGGKKTQKGVGKKIAN